MVNSQAGRLEVLISTMSIDSILGANTNEATCQLLALDGPPDGKCTSVRERHRCSKLGAGPRCILFCEKC